MFPLSKKHLLYAGRLSVISAFIGAPLAVLAFVAGFTRNAELEMISTLIGVVYTGVFVYVYLVFKQLLNERFHFHSADFAIWLYLGIGVLSTLLQLIVGSIEANTNDMLQNALVFSVVPAGAASVMVGIRLLRLQDDLFGVGKPFAYLLIAAGICLASVVLFPLVVLFGIVLDILMAVIFFRAAGRNLL